MHVSGEADGRDGEVQGGSAGKDKGEGWGVFILGLRIGGSGLGDSGVHRGGGGRSGDGFGGGGRFGFGDDSRGLGLGGFSKAGFAGEGQCPQLKRQLLRNLRPSHLLESFCSFAIQSVSVSAQLPGGLSGGGGGVH